MKKGGKLFVFTWYFFMAVLTIDLFLGFVVLGENVGGGIGMIIGSAWNLWFLLKVKELIEGE